MALALYATAADYALERGIIIADTKFELGLDADGDARARRRGLTPDSSRFWPADDYEPGRAQDSYDKQYVRDFCETRGWDKRIPARSCPRTSSSTRAKYVEAFEKITGIAFDAYVADPSTVLA